MFVDKQLLLSDAQEETTVAAHDSDNIIDQGVASDAAKELYMVFLVTTAFTSAGAATVALSLQDSPDNATYTEKLGVAAQTYANFTAGKRYVMRLPQGMNRYIKGVLTIGTAVLTAGAFDWFLTDAPQTNQ